MSTASGIEWTDVTWNPVVGCTPVSPGCLNCYAATMSRRLEGMGRPEYVGLTVKRKGSTRAAGPEDATPATAIGKVSRDVFNGTVRTLEDRLTDPLRWRKPRRVFVNSMSDLFHEDVPCGFIDRVFAVMALCPQHTFQVLTKRPERMAEYLDVAGHDWVIGRSPHPDRWDIALREFRLKAGCFKATWPLPNVWLGTSVEDQSRLDERIPHLVKCPAAVRFLSCEPLLEEVDLCIPRGCRGCNHSGNVFPRETCRRCGGTGHEQSIDWVIVGGESGAHARPCDVGWIRSVVSQCNDAHVPCFVKQLGRLRFADAMGATESDRAAFSTRWKDAKGGDLSEWPEDLRVREWPKGVAA
jgi:protein gp37